MRHGRSLVIALHLIMVATSARADDPRSYMHGIEAVPDGRGNFHIFFSSAGLPPVGAVGDEDWTHDVYRSLWKPGDLRMRTPQLFIVRSEAQEPVSAASTRDGRIMVSLEDGWNTRYEVSQRYGVYDSALQPIAPYPRDVAPGGHSGHVAAVGDRFVVAYSSGWYGGGAGGNGTGFGVYARSYDSSGNLINAFDIEPRRRAWWPIIAASPTRALVVWQQYVPDQQYARLRIAVVDPNAGSIERNEQLYSRLKYYSHHVGYVPNIDRYFVAGNDDTGNGFAFLLDAVGRVTAKLMCMPPLVRESGVAVIDSTVFLPTPKDRVLHLALTPNSIALRAVQNTGLQWQTMGSVGLPSGPRRLHWVSLTTHGYEEADIDLNDARDPSDRDRCVVD